MAQEAADEKTESQDTTKDAQQSIIDTFTKIRTLIDQREKELLNSVNSETGSISVRFDMESIQKVEYFPMIRYFHHFVSNMLIIR